MIHTIRKAVKILNEAFSSQHRRFYQRKWDEDRREMLKQGFDPSSYVPDDTNVKTSQVNKAKREFEKFLREKELRDLREQNIEDVIEKVDDLVTQLEKLGKENEVSEIVDAALSMKHDDPEMGPHLWMYDRLYRLLHPISDEDNWETSQEKMQLDTEFPEEYPELTSPTGELQYAGTPGSARGLFSDLTDEQNIEHITRRLIHMVKLLQNKLDLSKIEISSFLDYIDIDDYLIELIFPNHRYEPIAAGRAIKRIKNADKNLMSTIRSSLIEIMKYGEYKQSSTDFAESRLLEDLAIITEDGIKFILSGTLIKVIKEMKVTDNLDTLVYKEIDRYKKGELDFTECEKNITEIVNAKLQAGGDQDELIERYKEYIFQLEMI